MSIGAFISGEVGPGVTVATFITRGLSIGTISVPTSEGLQFTIPGSREHYTVMEARMHYSAAVMRYHYTISDQNP